MLPPTFRALLRTLAFAFLCVAISNSADANIIVYDNGAGGAAGLDGALQSDSSATFIRADGFVLTATTQITGIEWTGIYSNDNSPGVDDFTISIYSNNLGSPSSNPPVATYAVGNSVNRTDSGENAVAGFDIFNYSASINFEAAGNTQYWLSIFNDTSTDANDTWSWGRANFGDFYTSNDGGSSWTGPTNSRLDFRLTAVPEPTSALLVGLGMFTAASMRHRRR